MVDMYRPLERAVGTCVVCQHFLSVLLAAAAGAAPAPAPPALPFPSMIFFENSSGTPAGEAAMHRDQTG